MTRPHAESKTGRGQAAGLQRGTSPKIRLAIVINSAAKKSVRTPSLSRLGEIALSYARRGWYVFPIKAAQKMPPLVRWSIEATTDEATIRRWWTKWPNANVGIACGPSGLCVIDLDQKKGKDGQAELDKLEAIHGRLPNTLSVRTPTGGWHLYFRGSTGSPPFVTGIDIKSVGGLVVAPGSRTGDGDYTWANDEPVAALPPWLEGLIGAPRKHEKRSEIPAVELDNEVAIDWAQHYLAHDAAPSIEDQNGNNATYKVAARLFGQGLAEQTALDMMLELYNPRCEPPWSHQEMHKLVGNAYRYAQNQAGSESAAADFADEPLAVSLQDHVAGGKRSRLHPRSYADLKDLQEKRWRVDRLIPDNGLAVVYGRPKVGKTFWALDLALSVATGRDFHGGKVERGRVTYVAAEGGAARLRDRVAAWLRERGIDERELEGWWDVVLAPVNLVDHLQVGEFLKELGGQRSLVVFDTLARCMSGDENSQKDMGAAVAGCDRVRTETGAAVLLVHHEGKDGSKGARGSTVLLGAIDASIRGKADGGHITFYVEDMRDDEAPPPMTFELANVVLGDLHQSSAVLRLLADRLITPSDTLRVRDIAVDMDGAKKMELEAAVAEALTLKPMTARRRVDKAIPESRDNAVSHDGGLLWLNRPGKNPNGGLIVRFERET